MLPLSHPARGAWIETANLAELARLRRGRTPLGVRGLKHYRVNHGTCV